MGCYKNGGAEKTGGLVVDYKQGIINMLDEIHSQLIFRRIYDFVYRMLRKS